MPRGVRDGSGKGRGMKDGLRSNRNPVPCSDERGNGKGKGENREK